MLVRCSSIYRHACYVRCRPIFMHSVVILHTKKRNNTVKPNNDVRPSFFFSFFSFVLSHASYQFFKCVDVDDADNRVIESTPIILFGLNLEHTSEHIFRHFFGTLKVHLPWRNIKINCDDKMRQVRFNAAEYRHNSICM